MLQRPTDAATSTRMRAAIELLTAPGREQPALVEPRVTAGDVVALIWAMRGLVQAAGEVRARGRGSDSLTSSWPECERRARSAAHPRCPRGSCRS